MQTLQVRHMIVQQFIDPIKRLGGSFLQLRPELDIGPQCIDQKPWHGEVARWHGGSSVVLKYVLVPVNDTL